MAEQLLRNPDVTPTDSVLAEALGPANGAYRTFVAGLDQHEIVLNYQYYTDGKSWLGKGVYRWTGARGGQKETTAFWLSIWKGFFKVTLYIPEKFRADALDLPVDDAVRRLIDASRQIGKLKFFPLVFDISSEDGLDPVYVLIDFRKKLK